MRGGAILELIDVSKKFGQTQVLNPTDLVTAARTVKKRTGIIDIMCGLGDRLSGTASAAAVFAFGDEGHVVVGMAGQPA